MMIINWLRLLPEAALPESSLTLSLRMTSFAVFPDYFSFDHFLSTFFFFRKKDQVH